MKQKAKFLSLVYFIIVLAVACFYPHLNFVKALQSQKAVTAVVKENFINIVGMQMIKLNSGYWVGTYEVTRLEYANIMTPNNIPKIKGNFPIDMIVYENAVEFCAKLTEQERTRGTLPKGFIYSLPNEKQWMECFADAKVKDAVVNQSVITCREPFRVGTLQPNRLGLYDMIGNVAEWCTEWYDPQQKEFGHLIKGAPYWESNSDFF